MITRPSDSTYNPGCLYGFTRPELTRVKKVVVQSFSKEEVRQIEEDLEFLWFTDGRTEAEVAQMKSVLSFEVVREEDL